MKINVKDAELKGVTIGFIIVAAFYIISYIAYSIFQ